MYSFLYFSVFITYWYPKIQPEVCKTNEKVFKLVKQFYICWFILHNEDIVNIPAKMIGFKTRKGIIFSMDNKSYKTPLKVVVFAFTFCNTSGMKVVWCNWFLKKCDVHLCKFHKSVIEI